MAEEQEEEGHVEGEEEQEEGDGRAERADQEDGGEDEPACEEEAEGVVEVVDADWCVCGACVCSADAETWGKNAANGNPESTV